MIPGMITTDMRDDQECTLELAAVLCGVSYQTIRNWVDRFDLPVVRRGRSVRVRIVDLRELEQSGVVSLGRPELLTR